MSEKTLGQIGFDAYGEHANWTAFDGRPMPRWDDNLRADIKEKWLVAADAVANQAVRDYVKHITVELSAGRMTPNFLLEFFGVDPKGLIL